MHEETVQQVALADRLAARYRDARLIRQFELVIGTDVLGRDDDARSGLSLRKGQLL